MKRKILLCSMGMALALAFVACDGQVASNGAERQAEEKVIADESQLVDSDETEDNTLKEEQEAEEKKAKRKAEKKAAKRALEEAAQKEAENAQPTEPVVTENETEANAGAQGAGAETSQATQQDVQETTEEAGAGQEAVNEAPAQPVVEEAPAQQATEQPSDPDAGCIDDASDILTY